MKLSSKSDLEKGRGIFGRKFTLSSQSTWNNAMPKPKISGLKSGQKLKNRKNVITEIVFEMPFHDQSDIYGLQVFSKRRKGVWVGPVVSRVESNGVVTATALVACLRVNDRAITAPDSDEVEVTVTNYDPTETEPVSDPIDETIEINP